jgi:hypothetical protein
VLSAFVRQHAGAEMRVERKPSDQSHLQQSLRDLDALLSAFPIKGDPRA